MTNLCCDTSLYTVVVHEHFEYLRDDLRKVDLQQEKTANGNLINNQIFKSYCNQIDLIINKLEV